MNPVEKYGWLYRLDKAKDKVEVIPSEKDKRELPQTLHKYYALNDNLVKSLKGEYLYAPHPEQLNDPFDCNHILVDLDDVDKIFRFTKGHYTKKEIESKLGSRDLDFIETIQYNYRVIYFQKYGLISLCEDSKNTLMWAYYGNNQGICIEFDYSLFGFDYYGPFQINYQEDILPMSYKEADDLAFFYQTNIKTLAWVHEREWRMLPFKTSHGNIQVMKMPGIDKVMRLQEEKNVKAQERHFEYPTSCIKSISLGTYFFHPNNEYVNSRKEVKDIKLSENNRDIRRQVIDYIISKKIPTKIMGRKIHKFQLKSEPIELTKIEDDIYRMKIIK